jgi:hypothetical protein
MQLRGRNQQVIGRRRRENLTDDEIEVEEVPAEESLQEEEIETPTLATATATRRSKRQRR